ncbi:hypothetical protein [Catenulispora subtropica]|uniref:Uncharacterized protein n=1 Tax=Catenulispora subtropica TaxID=450798 RepID=A0ABP5DSS2_9ACTN
MTGPERRGDAAEEAEGDVEAEADADVDVDMLVADETGAVFTEPELLHPASAVAPTVVSKAHRTARPTFRPTKTQCPKSNQWTLT